MTSVSSRPLLASWRTKSSAVRSHDSRRLSAIPSARRSSALSTTTSRSASGRPSDPIGPCRTASQSAPVASGRAILTTIQAGWSRDSKPPQPGGWSRKPLPASSSTRTAAVRGASPSSTGMTQALFSGPLKPRRRVTRNAAVPSPGSRSRSTRDCTISSALYCSIRWASGPMTGRGVAWRSMSASSSAPPRRTTIRVPGCMRQFAIAPGASAEAGTDHANQSRQMSPATTTGSSAGGAVIASPLPPSARTMRARRSPSRTAYPPQVCRVGKDAAGGC